MRVTILGSGTSHGVPTIDCMIDDYAHCPMQVCRKAASDPRYRRTRSSLLLEWPEATILVDTSQDFYTQMLRQRVKRIDAVLYTHAHADHIYGLPDIRSYCRAQKGSVDVYGSDETLGALRAAFGYVFEPPENVGGGIPALETHVLTGPTEVAGHTIIPVPVAHGPLQGCQGYRVDGVAYLPDVQSIPPASLELLQGLDLLILNCLRLRPHATHLSLEQSVAYVEALAPRRALFTHMTHDIDPEVHAALLPAGASFAFDGLVLNV